MINPMSDVYSMSSAKKSLFLRAHQSEMLKVSVVIPTYNCAEHIGETLQSVLDQDYPNLEIIVVDDGSTDNTRDVVAGFRSDRITYVYQSNSGGPSKPRNVGIAHAQSQYIALFDSDDIMLPGKIQAAVEFFEMNSQLGLVFTNFVKCDEQGTPYPNPFLDGYHHFWMCQKRQVDDRRYVISAGVAYETLLKQNYIGTSSVVIRKSVFSEVGEFDETLSGPEDLDMWLRITSLYDIGFINLLGHRYRVRNNGITGRGEERLRPHDIRVMRRQLARELPDSLRKVVHADIAKRLWDLGYLHQCAGQM